MRDAVRKLTWRLRRFWLKAAVPIIAAHQGGHARRLERRACRHSFLVLRLGALTGPQEIDRLF
jgi:hypothetical protein